MSRKHLIFDLSKADFVTLLATFFILNAFWLLWQGEIYLAIALAFVSMFLDYVDGTVARRYGGSPFGKVFDSLYDILGWVLFPALVINVEAGWAWWAVTITTLFCLTGFVRLGRFTVDGYEGTDTKYYVGMPVLFSKYALLVCLIAEAQLSVAILACMIPLMVSSRRFRKPHPLLTQLELVYAALFVWLNGVLN